MEDKVRTEILKIVGYNDYLKGKKLNTDCILRANYEEDEKKFVFLVRSEENIRTYIVYIYMDSANIINHAHCTCSRYSQMGYCKHIAACLINYAPTIFPNLTNSNLSLDQIKRKNDLNLLKNIESYYDEDDNVGIKKHVNLEITYDFITHTYGSGFYISWRAKIGLDKLYSLNSKISGFYYAMLSDDIYTFTKKFTYDPKTMYLDESDKSLIKILYDSRCYSGSIDFSDDNLKYILNNYKDKIHFENNDKNVPIIEGFPFKSNLKKDNDDFILDFDFSNVGRVGSLTRDNEYLATENAIYHLNKKERSIFETLYNNGFEHIKFDKKSMPIFEKGLLRSLKKNIKIENGIDLVISDKPTFAFYFDIDKNDFFINATIKFNYNGEEIDYFYNNTKTPNNILRDIDFENNTSTILSNYNFAKGDKFFYINDVDESVNFLESGLPELADKYKVFTSEKIDNTKIKKAHAEAMFGIGKDEILSYNFKLDSVPDEELNSLLDSLKNKKKYYRLKNGDIVNLEDESLKELNDLSDDLDADGFKGEIPKYRALYLDSLRNSKYHIIKTDSIFNNFIKNFKEYKNADVKFDKSDSMLRDYQVDGVKWLYTIYKCGFGGILADEMGLGKSLQTLIFFKKILEEKKDAKFLIVAPSGLIYNWENEIKKWIPKVSFEVLAGNPSKRKEIVKKTNKTILITSYATLREDIDLYEDKKFEVMIIDEAQNIKNAKAGITKSVKKINANTKFALTGTPIENSILELWSIFDFIMPGFLSSAKKFQEKYHFSDFDDKANDMLSHLKRQVKPFILRRKKSDVTKELPPKIENNIYIDLDDNEKKLYAATVKKTRKDMDDLIKTGGFNKSKMMILSLLTRLRQLCIDPHIVFEDYKGSSAKIESLISLIKELVSNGHKILLFTSFKTALNIVKKELDKESISNFTISGDVPSKRRQEMVDAFNKDDTKVFLIMLRAGGTGLNLTAADVVIHLDPWWNPQAENQATDRTHRIGQTKTVEVIKLICRGTIEEKIISLQEKKKKLSDAILEQGMDDSTIINNLTEKEIKDLLSYTNND